MGWLFNYGTTRRQLIAERTKDWETIGAEGILVKSICLAHCYPGSSFSGVLWSVWERSFTKDGQSVRPAERWIMCDLLQYRKYDGWGYKDIDESMGPCRYSRPLKYLEMVPIEQYGGNAPWREGVRSYHARQVENRRQRRLRQAG